MLSHLRYGGGKKQKKSSMSDLLRDSNSVLHIMKVDTVVFMTSRYTLEAGKGRGGEKRGVRYLTLLVIVNSGVNTVHTVSAVGFLVMQKKKNCL